VSILAQITVVECDGCKRLVTLTNDVERKSFDELWLRTKKEDLCFTCRELVDQADEKAIARVIAKINRKYMNGGMTAASSAAALEVTNG
jgi:hypothetical protein